MVDARFSDAVSEFEQRLGIGASYDVEKREIKVFSRQINIYYLSGLTDGMQAIKIIESILTIPRKRPYSFELVRDNLSHHAVKVVKDWRELRALFLDGVIIMIFEGEERALAIDVRKYPTRGISEPDMEKVIRGAHDGFTENFHLNVALLRRRIKDERLRNEIFTVGTASATIVCLSYIEGICSEDVQRRSALNLETSGRALDHGRQGLEELIIRRHLNPYPLVRYTERRHRRRPPLPGDVRPVRRHFPERDPCAGDLR